MATTKKRGRPKGSTSKAMKSAADIYVPKEGKYHCTCCGLSTVRMELFPACHSPFWKENNYRIPICLECLEKYFQEKMVEFNSDVMALEYICMHFDLYFSRSKWDSTKNMSGTSRLTNYIRLANLNGRSKVYKTYDTTLQERKYTNIASSTQQAVDDIAPAVEGDMTEETQERQQKVYEQQGLDTDKINRLRDKFGSDFTVKELQTMEKHYGKLMSQLNSTHSSNEDIIIEQTVNDACTMLIMKERKVKEGDSEAVMKIMKDYQKLITGKDFSQYLKSQQASLSEGDCIGKWTKQIEEFCPADIYKDKSLYDDQKGLKKLISYIRLNFVRPRKNFETANYEPHPDYNIEVD